jgi:acyl-CoA synthetase (AMP-forming)/AMP-acid ligase II
MSLINSFIDNCKNTPDKIALVINERPTTYSELYEQARRLVFTLERQGVKSGDHLGVILGNCQEFVLMMLAALDMGLVLVPLPHSLEPQAIRKGLAATDTRHVVAWHSILKRLLDDGFDPAEGMALAVGGDAPGCYGFGDAGAPPEDFQLGRFGDMTTRPFILTMTSGSTGDPKPIVLTQQTKIFRADNAIRLYDLTADDVILAATPLYHSLAERLVLLPLILGGTSVVMPTFSPQLWLDTVNRWKATFTIAVSSQLTQILSLLKQKSGFDNTLRCLVSSSALLDASSKMELIESLQCEFHECYGASEISSVTDIGPEHSLSKLDSVGRAVKSADIKIIGRDGVELPLKEIGEICVSTPMLFSGYYKRDDKTREAMIGEYFRTGDLGWMDEDGFLYFTGRLKEIINTGGINVYPKDIEEVLLRIDGVEECVAVPYPDEQLGEKVVALVVLTPESALTPKKIQRMAAMQLADFQVPRLVEIVKELPKNEMGKIIRRRFYENQDSQLEKGSRA